jgi:hypothetical protein
MGSYVLGGFDGCDGQLDCGIEDIGGGNGQMLAAILKSYPGIRGVLFDLPAVVESARPLMTGSGMDDRYRFVGGDFLASIPVAADAQVMRHILHDFSDDNVITILRNCRTAMPPGGKVLIVETVIPSGNEPCYGKWLDLMMLLIGGRERTEEEFRRLFSTAGLTLDRIIRTASEVSVIEGSRKDF